MKFRVLPVRTAQDATLNFEQLQLEFESPWTPLVLVEALEYNTGGWEPAVRLEGSTVRLRGLLKVKAGKEVAAGGTLFTLAAPFRPAKVSGFVAIKLNGTAVYLQVELNGEVKVAVASLPAAEQLWLDGLTFSVS
jgi:hypothetical protein